MDVIERFFEIYPDGFEDIRFLEQARKHDHSKITEFFDDLTNEKLDSANPHMLAEQLGKTLSKSSWVSTFEKITFRNFLSFLDGHSGFIMALKHLRENYNQQNFDNFVDVLSRYKSERNANAAKWPVISFFAYHNVLSHTCFPVKPTALKQIAALLDVDIQYSPRPSFEIYERINQMYRDFREQSPYLKEYEPIKTHALLYVVAIS